jgi:hypothetical protein
VSNSGDTWRTRPTQTLTDDAGRRESEGRGPSVQDSWLMPTGDDDFNLASQAQLDDFETMRQKARSEWALDPYAVVGSQLFLLQVTTRG